MKRLALLGVAILTFGIQQCAAQFSIGVLGGYGFNDGYKIGFGARAGFSASLLYVGAIGVIHTGQEEDIQQAAQSINVKTNASYYGAEVGINLGTLRPSLILGAVNNSFEEAGQEKSDANFLLGPGVTLFVPLSSNFYIGGDARLLIAGTSDFNIDSLQGFEDAYDNPGGTLLALYATIGFTF
jgi:hypothetical protein